MNRPDSYLNWTDGNSTKVIDPPSGLKFQGWSPGQAPPSQYFNWLLWKTDQWIQYFDEITNSGVPEQAIRLINGGFLGFNSQSNILKWSDILNIAIPGSPDSANAIAAGNVTLADGYLAYVALVLPVIASGNLVNGSDMITALNYTGNLSIGMTILGNGIPSGATILAVSTNSVQMSAPATADVNNNVMLFSTVNSLTVQTAQANTFIPDTDHLVIARRVGGRVFIGINANIMVLQNGESKKLLETGYLQTYDDVIAGENISAGQAVYVSPGGSADGGRTVGQAYLLDCSAGNGQRSFFAGIAIETTTAGNALSLVFTGFANFTSLTPGAVYYGSDTVLGGLTTPKPSSVGASIMPVGVAVSATKLLMTTAEGVVGPQNQSIFEAEKIGVGNGVTTSFPLTQTPLNQNSTFIFVDGMLLNPSEWSLSGLNVVLNTPPAPAQAVDAQYIQANQLDISAMQEIPTKVAPSTYQLAGMPLNQNSMMVFIDSLRASPNAYSLVLGSNSAQIVLNTDLTPGQTIEVLYFQNIAGNGGFGTVTAGSNEGSGHAIFDTIVAGVMKFFSLKAGGSTSIANDGHGNLVISSTGGSGGSSRQVYGDPTTPETFDPTSGLVAGAEMDQTWIIEPPGGAVPVTAAAQIQNGTIVGQRLTLRGLSPVNYYEFQGLAGSVVANLSLDGNCQVTDNQALTVEWDGTLWFEVCRRS